MIRGKNEVAALPALLSHYLYLYSWTLFTEEKNHVRRKWIKQWIAKARIWYKGNTSLLSFGKKEGTARRKGVLLRCLCGSSGQLSTRSCSQ